MTIQEENEYLKELLLDVIEQSCWDWKADVLNSCAMAVYAEAMRYLNRIGKIKIIREKGRNVIAEINED